MVAAAVTAIGLGSGFGAQASTGDIEIPDANLKACLNSALGSSRLPDADITEAEMQSISFLDCDNAEVTELTGLGTATNLSSLDLGQNNIVDISELVSLSNLSWLWLSGNHIADLSPLANLSGLRFLILNDTQTNDIGALSGLSNLEELNLSGNSVGDLEPLEGLTGLRSLDLYGNQLTDISSLSGLDALQTLNLSGNQITELSDLSDLSNLETLSLVGNQVSDIAPLAELTQLEQLVLTYNQITDISPLAGLNNLESLVVYGQRVLMDPTEIGTPVSNPVRGLDGAPIELDAFCDPDSVDCSQMIYPSAGQDIEANWSQQVTYGTGNSTYFWGAVVRDVLSAPVTQFLLTFDLNGGEGDFPAMVVPAGEAVDLPSELPVLEGYSFAGWLPKSTTDALVPLEPGASYTPSSDVTFVAQWAKTPVAPINPGKPMEPSSPVGPSTTDDSLADAVSKAPNSGLAQTGAHAVSGVVAAVLLLIAGIAARRWGTQR